MMIEKLKMKLTTKSKIEKRLPDMKNNSEQKVEDNFRLPVFWQTPCYAFALLLGLPNLVLCPMKQSVSMCVGLVALLQFFVWLCAAGKTANVLPNALAYTLSNLIIFHLSPDKIAVAVMLQLKVILFSIRTFLGT